MKSMYPEHCWNGMKDDGSDTGYNYGTAAAPKYINQANPFSKVLYMVTLYSTCTRAPTFENSFHSSHGRQPIFQKSFL